MLEVDETCDYPFDVHDALRRERLIGLAIPEEYGGEGANSVTFCSYVEELAKVSATASLMAAYVKLTALPIILAGSAEQKQRFLPGLRPARCSAPTRSPSRAWAPIRRRCRCGPRSAATCGC